MRGADQNYGAAQADMYLRAGNAPFWWNFVKGYFGIWLQAVLVITLGVTFSTFLSGPVAMIATAGALLGGFFSDFMYRLSTQQTYGGGPFESLRRLVTQEGITAPIGAQLPGDCRQGARSGGGTRPASARLDLARLRTLQLLRPRRQRLQYPRRPRSDLHVPGVCLPAAGVRGRLLVSEEPRSGEIEGLRIADCDCLSD